jgi:hypothetical protein
MDLLHWEDNAVEKRPPESLANRAGDRLVD